MRRSIAVVAVLLAGCVTSGSAWMAQPLGGDDPSWSSGMPSAEPAVSAPPAPASAAQPARSAAPSPGKAVGGRVLGVFRNTYYNFPREADYKGPTTRLMSATCSPLAEVPKAFHDTVCVQGSGRLRDGTTVSFARRDCECAEVCPRTDQKICFDALDKGQFPWGRGATGKPITPFLTIAVDPAVIPLGTPVYIPEYDGLPVEEGGQGQHDGCFLAQDRGKRVQGNHLDVFTGSEKGTSLWNNMVPSNKGVTVTLDSPRCSALAAP